MLSFETINFLLENKSRTCVVFPEGETLKKPQQEVTQNPPLHPATTVLIHPLMTPKLIFVNFPSEYFANKPLLVRI